MGSLKSETNYESLRLARISENQARLASLGLEKSVSELRTIISSRTPSKTPRNYCKKVYSLTSLRRSNRLKGVDLIPQSLPYLRRSSRLNPKPGENAITSPQARVSLSEQTRRKLFVKEERVRELKNRLSPDALARRCDSKSRGSIYDSVFGICCHFCRQKKLCGEEDCKHCGNLDNDQPCIGKTNCSVCQSSNGVLCRACLKVRYGEELEEVRENKEWMCPHCIEDKGIKPYWICNSSLCLKKRKMVPTGIAIYEAREMGYESVAHLLMEKLQQKALK
ncbi:Zinc-finger domain of monoamine-oxidase A repressor R1 [Macleaya cordata]|uniref:Zinc-finger domain of monoamine-oxidase A repressor R1 n=1 Tax=Macleaya cordata TaxID=56857 RepID=A0A200PME5_MACCD|nr:Zinc-finger domain of monoamine-oxidase A repressor R1 [Macleaya cordata]